MDINTFPQSYYDSLVEGVRGATHKIAARLTHNVIRSARLIAKDDKGVCNVFLESEYGRTYRKIFSTEVLFDGRHIIAVTIWRQKFFKTHSNAEKVIKQELRICEVIYKLPKSDFRAELKSSD